MLLANFIVTSIYTSVKGVILEKIVTSDHMLREKI